MMTQTNTRTRAHTTFDRLMRRVNDTLTTIRATNDRNAKNALFETLSNIDREIDNVCAMYASTFDTNDERMNAYLTLRASRDAYVDEMRATIDAHTLFAHIVATRAFDIVRDQTFYELMRDMSNASNDDDMRDDDALCDLIVDRIVAFCNSMRVTMNDDMIDYVYDRVLNTTLIDVDFTFETCNI